MSGQDSSRVEQREYWNNRNRYYHKSVEDLVRFLVPEGEKVLEIRSGTGDLLAAVCPRDGLGIDADPEMVKVAQSKHAGLKFLVMDPAETNLTEQFDWIILSDAIGHFVDVETVFRKLKTVSHPRTRIIITYYNYLWEPFLRLAEILGLKSKQPLQHWLSEHDIGNLLSIAGFETLKKGKKVLIPFRIPFLSSILNRFVANLPLVNRFCLVQYVIARPADYIQRDYSVSVIVPARNEKGNIEQLIKRLPDFGLSNEIIFVEGHSKDGTLEEIKRLTKMYQGKRKILWSQQEGSGKADAVRKGFAMASGDIVMILDADMTVAPEDLPKFYLCMKENRGEFVNGSRLVYQMEKEAMRFLNNVANKFFGLMFSWIIGQRLKDTLCGTKTLFRSDYEKIAKNRAYFGDFDPFGDFDLIFGASKLNLKIVDLPIRYHERTYGVTQIRRFYHGWILLKMCIFAIGKLKMR